MATDPELSALLPPPPPPQPGRREEAIANAMRRFDGDGQLSSNPRPRRSWRFAGRPEFGALAAAALIAAIGLPLWLSSEYRAADPIQRRPTIVPSQSVIAKSAGDAATEPLSRPQATAAPTATARVAEASLPAPLDLQQVVDTAAKLELKAPPPAFAPPPPPIITPGAPPAPPPPSVVSRAAPRRADEVGDIVVTGTQASNVEQSAQRVSERFETVRGAGDAPIPSLQARGLTSPISWKRIPSNRELRSIARRYKSGPFEAVINCKPRSDGRLKQCGGVSSEPNTGAAKKAAIAIAQTMIIDASSFAVWRSQQQQLKIVLIVDDGFPSQCSPPDGCKWLSGGAPTPAPPPPPKPN